MHLNWRNAICSSLLLALCATTQSVYADDHFNLWHGKAPYVSSPAAKVTEQADGLAMAFEEEQAILLYTAALKLDKNFPPALRKRGM